MAFSHLSSRKTSVICTTLLLQLFLWLAAGGRILTHYDYNVGCSSLGPFTEFGIEFPTDARNYTVQQLGQVSLGEFTGGQLQGWKSTFPVDAVILNERRSATACTYSPAGTLDALDLHTPYNEKTGSYPDISKITFCYLPPVLICQTVSGSHDLVFTWNVTKSADQQSVVVPLGTPVETLYEYSLKPTKTEKNFTLSGSFLIRNPSVLRPIYVTVSATFGSVQLPLQCPYSPTPVPMKIEAGSSITCEYTKVFDTKPDMLAPVKVKVSVLPNSGVRDSCDDQVPLWKANWIDECVVLTDSVVGALGKKCYNWDPCITDTFPHTVSTTVCGIQNFTNTITAEATDTGTKSQSNPVTVTIEVPCGLSESCTGSGTDDLSYSWHVEKEPLSNATVAIPPCSPGQLAYKYELSSTVTRQQFTLTGAVDVCNPNKVYDVPLQSISATYGTETLTDFMCESSTGAFVLPGALLHGSCISCESSKEIAEQANSTVLAVNVVVAGGSMVPSKSASCGTVSWTVDDVFDECVNVSDVIAFCGSTTVADLGKKCQGDAMSAQFSTTLDTTGAVCGMHDAVDVVTVTGKDTGTSVESDNVTIRVEVPCNLHATLVMSGQYGVLYKWQVQKRAPATNITLAANQGQNVTYSYTLTPAESPANWTVSGTVTVSNVNSVQSVTFSVHVDFASASAVASCGNNTLSPGQSTTCSFVLHLSSKPSETAVAVAHVDATLECMSTTASASNPQNWTVCDKVDECVRVYDYVNGDYSAPTLVSTKCVGNTPQSIEGSFQYLVIKSQCGPCVVWDQLSAVGVDTNATAWSNNVTIGVYVKCEEGCTLTFGYWKTHSNSSDQKYDKHWNKYTTKQFYLSGLSYQAVLFTEPAGGNLYFSLAHQYIAALLNIDSGASVGLEAVTEALADANAFFRQYTQDNWPQSDPTHSTLTNAIEVLTDWNEGTIGPGHCQDKKK